MTKRIATELVVVAILVAAVAAFLSEGVPGLSECGYLLAGYRHSHAEFLATDWTFGTPVGKTLYYDALLGLATRALSLETSAWLGRLACWVAILLGLATTGRRVGLRGAGAWTAVALWLAFGQSFVGGEVAVGYFVPKAVAWAAGIWAVERYLAGRWLAAGLLLGACVGMQPSVGLGLSLGLAATMLLDRQPVSVWVRIVVPALFAAMPAIASAQDILIQPGVDLRAEWQFQAQVRQRVHLDLGSFKRWSLIALALALVGSASLGRILANSRYRQLVSLQIGPLVLFVAGAAVTALGHYEWLSLFPFRVLPLLAGWILLVGLGLCLQDRNWNRETAAAVALAGAVALLTTSPIEVLARAKRLRNAADGPDSPALRWIANHTPEGAMVVVSPARRCAPYLTRRPQIVYADLARLDRLREWRERLTALTGPLEPRTSRMDLAFHRMAPERLESAVRRFGGDYLVTRGTYSYPVVFESGGYRVYDLKGLATQRPPPTPPAP